MFERPGQGTGYVDNMRLWLDDVRDPSYSDWSGDDIVVCRTATAAIEALKTKSIELISFDHDLGGFLNHRGKDGLSGYDVACWLEKEVAEGRLDRLPAWRVHSNNPTGAERIRQAMRSAERFIEARSATE